MSNFINTKYKTTVESILDNIKDKLNNQYYIFNDKKACVVDYYNLNLVKSTLDTASRDIYANIGDESPLRYNIIEDAIIYGIDVMQLTREIGDWGVEEGGDLSGTCMVLPNTWVPMENDYFVIKHVNQNLLFKVNAVSPDTLESGANLYSVSYKLDRYDDMRIEDQVVNRYKFMINNFGTNYKTVILNTDYEIIEKLEGYTVPLKTYFKDLFFQRKTQAFVVEYSMDFIYDSYLIEFIIRNGILKDNGEFTYVDHALTLPKTFALNYDNTIFKSIENKNKDKINNTLKSNPFAITDISSSMNCDLRKFDYFSVEYRLSDNPSDGILYNFPQDLIYNIQNNILYTDTTNIVWNVVIKFYNNDTFDNTIFDIIDTWEIRESLNAFYAIPIVIYVLEYYIKTILV